MKPPEQNVIEMEYFHFAIVIGVVASKTDLKSRFSSKKYQSHIPTNYIHNS